MQRWKYFLIIIFRFLSVFITGSRWNWCIETFSAALKVFVLYCRFLCVYSTDYRRRGWHFIGTVSSRKGLHGWTEPPWYPSVPSCLDRCSNIGILLLLYILKIVLGFIADLSVKYCVVLCWICQFSNPWVKNWSCNSKPHILHVSRNYNDPVAT